MAFDMVIGHGEFAAESNVPKKEPNACTMEISFGGRRLTRKKRAGEKVEIVEVSKVNVMVKQIGNNFTMSECKYTAKLICFSFRSE
jgi:hypothetical protein